MVDDLSLLLGIASRKLARPSGQCIEFMSRERVVSESFDYDLLIIGAGVGGHGAALHAVKSGLKTAIVEADVMGGTCVNRGCIPSKALLAASGRVRELRNEHHLKALGIQIGQVSYDRGAIADHAKNLVSKIQGDMTNSLSRLGVDIINGWARMAGEQKAVIDTPEGEKNGDRQRYYSVSWFCPLCTTGD